MRVLQVFMHLSNAFFVLLNFKFALRQKQNEKAFEIFAKMLDKQYLNLYNRHCVSLSETVLERA